MRQSTHPDVAMPIAEGTRQTRLPTAPPAGAPRSDAPARRPLALTARALQRAASNRGIGTVISSMAALQAHAGNAAVARLVAQREPAGATAPPQGAAPPTTTTGATPIATTAAVPPTEGKDVEQLGVVDNDTAGGGGLNLRAAPEGNVLTRLAHNDHVMVKREMAKDWLYVIATDGAAKGTAGYVSRLYVNRELPPDPAEPDPGATLHRVQGGERAHEFVRRQYGAKNIDTGQDQRFFTNVLQYVNEKAGRGRFFVTKTKMRQPGGAGVSVPYEDIELVAGGKIWVPSLDFALSLKGTVSAGSGLRDFAEKVKGIGKKLLAIPAFIGGLVVGGLESIKDLFVGLFDLIWGAIKTLGGNLVDAAKAIYGIVTKPAMRQKLLDSIESGLRERLYTGSFLSKAYQWGRIVGYATMEIVSFVLLAGLASAFKAGKFAKFIQVLVKESEAIQKTIKAAEAIKNSEAMVKITEQVSKAGGVASKVLEKAAPVTKPAGKAIGAVGTVLNAPSDAVLGTAKWVAGGIEKGGATGGKVAGVVKAGEVAQVAKDAQAAERAGSVVSVFHGTTAELKDFGGLTGGKINVAKGSSVQDLGRGFYLATDKASAERYAERTARHSAESLAKNKELQGGATHVMQWDIPVEKLGNVVDVRPGGNFAKEWEAYLDSPLGGVDLPMVPRTRKAFIYNNDARGDIFNDFLRKIGKSNADTVIAPLGVEPFTGIGQGTQICVRSQKVADVLNEIMRAAAH
jgi:hypothetical protein